jgi:2-iminobutanoate/2-iminopropanoate deaminase
MSIKRFASPLPVPFSKAVRAGDFLFLSGVLAMDAELNIVAGGIAVETRTILGRIAQTLLDCGSSMDKVVRATVFLADLKDFAAFNEEYAKHFANALPARSTVEAQLFKGARIEIEVQAWMG